MYSHILTVEFGFFGQKFAKVVRAGCVCILTGQKDDEVKNCFIPKNNKLLVVADRFSHNGFKVVAKNYV